MIDKNNGLIDLGRGPLILIFYDGYELCALPGKSGRLKSHARRLVRYIKRSLLRQQVRTGFYTAFLGLRDSLKAVGCDVRVNNFELARKYPNYPIGIAGYPSVLQRIDLPNPRIFGPGDFGFPPESAEVAADPRMVKLIQPSDWFCDIYRPQCGDKLWTWFAGIDTAKWPDASGNAKTVDFLIYDKLRWHRDSEVPRILNRVTQHLNSAGHSYTILRYGQHHHSQFMASLTRAQAMIFLCEHETQGLAYQEALAMNVPILAWDEGILVDPTLVQYRYLATRISSVPYFNRFCGLTFKIADFEDACTRFWQHLKDYQPRHFVETTLSLKIAGENYVREYAAIAATSGN